MLDVLIEGAAGAVPILPLSSESLAAWGTTQAPAGRAWVAANRFEAKAGTVCPVPDAQGGLLAILFGRDEADPWCWAHLPAKLPAGDYRLEDGLDETTANWAALAWALACYRFGRYKAEDGKAWPRLVWPARADRGLVARTVAAYQLVRDLVNTPAEDLGPEELAAAGQDLAGRYGAKSSVIVGDDLLANNYPAVHRVGRAATKAPRLLDIIWGDPDAPKVTLVGKGVCFDSGGLDIKPASGMRLMKKDMGGAAHALALGGMIMDAGLPVRLRVLVPSVENAVAGNAMRPMDVIPMRSGLTVEIGNTDAEGRLILADCLTEAATETPTMLIDFATLTGAARVALGPELPALFCNDDALAGEFAAAAAAEHDPHWRLPLWKGYRRMLDSKIAEVNSAPEGGMAGAITAALFLQEFVPAGTPWAHLDIFSWNGSSRPGRPEGGEAMTLRALYRMLAERHPG